MTRQVIFSPEAETQLVALPRHIAFEKSSAIAERFTGSIVRDCEGFKVSSHRGTRRDDIRPGLRTVGFRRRATIAFTVEDSRGIG